MRVHPLVLVAAIALLASPVMAQNAPAIANAVASTPVVAATSAVHVVDFTPILSQLLELGGVLMTGLLTYVIARVGAWVKTRTGVALLEKDSLIGTQLETGLQNAIKYGVQKVGSSNFGHVDVKNQILAEAASYATSHVPDALKHFGITAQGVQEKLLPRLQSYIDRVGTPVATDLKVDASASTFSGQGNGGSGSATATSPVG